MSEVSMEYYKKMQIVISDEFSFSSKERYNSLSEDEKAKMDFIKGFFKALWDTGTGLVSLIGGLIKFSATTDVLGVCKLIDMSPPKWAKNT